MLIFAALCSSTAEAQLLYSISGRGLKAKSYIMGSHHFTDYSFVEKIPGSARAFKSVEQVCGEVDMSYQQSREASEMVMQAMMLPDGKTLKDIYSDEEMERINDFMRSVVGVELTHPIFWSSMGRMRPMAVVQQISTMLYMRSHPDFNIHTVMDMKIQEEARRSGKAVLGLESIEYQIGVLFGGYTPDEERQQLLDMADNAERAVEDLHRLNKAYAEQSAEQLVEVLESQIRSEGDRRFMQELTVKRNRNWVEQMPEIMAERPTLFVVGALHLYGEDGVVELLRKEGYKVKAVKR